MAAESQQTLSVFVISPGGGGYGSSDDPGSGGYLCPEVSLEAIRKIVLSHSGLRQGVPCPSPECFQQRVVRQRAEGCSLSKELARRSGSQGRWPSGGACWPKTQNHGWALVREGTVLFPCLHFKFLTVQVFIEDQKYLAMQGAPCHCHALESMA